MEEENKKLKQLVLDLSLDMQMLEGNNLIIKAHKSKSFLLPYVLNGMLQP